MCVNLTHAYSIRLFIRLVYSTYIQYTAHASLQDVLRNWHSREASIIQTMTDLVANAEEAAKAFRDGESPPLSGQPLLALSF